MIQGKYYSFTSGSIGAGTDLIQVAESLTGISNIVAKKITIIAADSILVDINNLGVYSTLFMDSDKYYKLSLDSNDVVVSSLIVGQTTASPVFLAMVF